MLLSGTRTPMVLPRGQGFHQAVIRITHLGIGADLGQVAAHQGEMVFIVGAPDALDPLHRGLVADMTAERVA
jgi:hypothetical protein